MQLPSFMSSLPWLEANDPFPPIGQTWGRDSPAPGLLAAGGALDVPRLRTAYANGIFPWFSEGQPILWWSPDPRMVLPVKAFRLHRSLRRVLRRFIATPGCEVRMDSDFAATIAACAHTQRTGQSGTWIVPAMQEAYLALHAAGVAHSVETWVNGTLVGGLYCISIGRALFGESMFAHATDASKIAFAALIGLCRHHDIPLIDCQQNTRHLASLGAYEIPRDDFLKQIYLLREGVSGLPFPWRFQSDYWQAVLSSGGASP